MSSPKLRQGFLRKLTLPAPLTRMLINTWPPFLGAGIRIEYLAPDFREARVRMRQGMLNSNIFGTHFGGSLYAMTDPFYALLLLRNLGPDHVIWDRRADIDFKLPARGTVRATFRIDDAILEDVRRRTAGGDKYEPVYPVDILDARGEVVASVQKTLYIRRRPGADKVTQ